MLLELFLEFFKLGAFTIGGGVAMIPILSDAMVNRKKWFSEEEMTDIIAISQSLPGVIAINMATYVGFRKKGFLGSLVATLAVLLPSFIIILIIASGFNFIEGNRYVQGALAGFRAASVGLVLVALWKVAKLSLKKAWQLVAAVAALVLIAVFKLSVAWIVVAYLLIGLFTVVINDRSTHTDGGGGSE